MSAPERDSRVRVLLLVDRLDERWGGGEMTVLGLARALSANRFEVWVCTSRLAGGWPIEALRAAGVRHLHLGRRTRLDLAAWRRLARTLREQRIEVLHAHMFGSNFWGSVIGRLSRVPVVIATEQTWSYEGRPLRKLLDAAIGRLVDAFIAVSSADAERMRRLERVPARKIVVIPNAWSSRPATDGRDLRAELGLSANSPVVAAVAVMRPQKRLELLLEAFATVRGAIPEARLLLAGDGPERHLLERRAAELALGQSVCFLGMRRDVAAVWRAADVGALSSDFEGTPLAALEAMSLGVPMVAPRVGGLPDIVEDERSGLLVEPGDPTALAFALRRLLTDGKLRERMGEAARARAGEFTAERHAARCAQLYQDLLARRGGGGRARRTASGGRA